MTQGLSPWADAAEIIASDIEVIFDVGANVGQTTMPLAQQFPKARIYGFEPVPSSYALFRTNTASLTTVTGFPHGFSDKKSSVRIFLQEDSGWNSVSKNIDRGLGETEVSLDTIDEFCREHKISHINIIKTDTEGHDLAVLIGAKAMLSQGRIDAIYSEVGFHRKDIGHTYFCDLLEYLQSMRFQFVSLYGLEGIKFVEHDVEPCYPWSNALFMKNALVQAKYGDEYARWWAGIRPPVKGAFK